MEIFEHYGLEIAFGAEWYFGPAGAGLISFDGTFEINQ